MLNRAKRGIIRCSVKNMISELISLVGDLLCLGAMDNSSSDNITQETISVRRRRTRNRIFLFCGLVILVSLGIYLSS
jgi:predicted nucleic acid-binding Zn ribbon protein